MEDTKEKPKGESFPFFFVEHIYILPNGSRPRGDFFSFFWKKKKTNHPSLEDPTFSQTF